MKFEQKMAQGHQRSRLKMLMDGRTDDGRKVITIVHPEQSFQIKILIFFSHISA